MPANMARASGVAVPAPAGWSFVLGALDLGGAVFEPARALTCGTCICTASFVDAGLVLRRRTPRRGEA